MTAETIKLQLVLNIINLPENKLAAANEFISRLVSEGAKNGVSGATPVVSDQRKISTSVELSPEDNPMLRYIGLTSYEPSATSIDEELYGGQSR